MDIQNKRKKKAVAPTQEAQPEQGKIPMKPGDGADVIAQTKAKMDQRAPAGQAGAMTGANQAPAVPVTRITDDDVRKAMTVLQRYKQGKNSLEERIKANELWYRLRHGSQATSSKTDANGNVVPANATDPDVSSAWLLNSLMNKHADFMDNYPSATVLPREEMDRKDAEMLTSILPTVLEQNDFESTYSDVCWYKLKMGTGVMQVYWDKDKLGGLGDIAIRKVDLLNLFWEPNVRDIQLSRNLFHVELHDREDVAALYPDAADAIRNVEGITATYQYDDSINTDDKVEVVDWYYKRNNSGKTVLHFCKFCCGKVLYASENTPEQVYDQNNPEAGGEMDYSQRGFYDHGRYPFVFDVLFPEEGMPYGFGYIDVCKNPQMYIDKLDSVYIKHAAMGARARFFKRVDAKVNADDLNDWTKDVVEYEGSANPSDIFYPIVVQPLDSNYITVREQKIDEMKETSGNRDFSQGSTSSGVTAASAIAALQEAGSKTSRDHIKASYRAFQAVCYMALDLMRQFYDQPREFRIVGAQGEMQFAEFQGQNISMQQMGGGFLPEASRVPFFDIRVVAMKSSPFSTVAQNERAKELFGLGFFRPDIADQALACLSMMQFEGIEQVRQKIQQNGTMLQAIQTLGQLSLAMAQQLDTTQGTMFTQQVAQLVQKYMAVTNQPSAGTGANDQQSNALGDALNGARNTQNGAARKDAAARSTPRV